MKLQMIVLAAMAVLTGCTSIRDGRIRHRDTSYSEGREHQVRQWCTSMTVSEEEVVKLAKGDIQYLIGFWTYAKANLSFEETDRLRAYGLHFINADTPDRQIELLRQRLEQLE